MKTKANKSLALKLIAFLTIAMFAVSCGGKNNTSGTGKKKSNSRNRNRGTSSMGTSSPHVGTVMQENPCLNGQGRTIVTIPVQMNIAANQTYIGVTSEGDVAVATNNGQPVLELHVCARQTLGGGQGQLMGNPVINSSPNCQVNEVTAATVALPSVIQGMPPIYLMFRAIYFGRGSSLCNMY